MGVDPAVGAEQAAVGGADAAADAITRPSARTRPDSTVSGRVKFTLVSTEV